MQFWHPDDELMCSKHVEAWTKLIVKQKMLCIKLVNYWDKYTEMHGQQNVKTPKLFQTVVSWYLAHRVVEVSFQLFLSTLM